MRRRVIRINGKVINEQALPVKQEPAIPVSRPQPDAVPRFNYTPGPRQSIPEIPTGATPPDPSSLRAFTLFNEHVFDQLLLQQGAYTEFRDRYSNPNMAIRSPGDTELMFRRMTVGDSLLLLAMQSANVDGQLHDYSENIDNYWEQVWWYLIQLLAPDRDLIATDPLVAVACAFEYTLRAGRLLGSQRLTIGMLQETFMRRSSPFYTGVSLRLIRTRNTQDRFSMDYVIMNNDSLDHMFMTATVILLYGIDNIARGCLNYQDSALPYPIIQHFQRFFEDRDLPVARHMTDEERRDLTEFRRQRGSHSQLDIGLPETVEAEVNIIPVSPDGTEVLYHDNQEADDDTGPGSVSINRLLP